MDDNANSTNANTRLLITAASGGVGAWAVQFARLAGISHITAVCGPRNADFVRSLGATQVVDYTKQSLREWAQDLQNEKPDLILDMVGRQTLSVGWSAVKDDGKLMSIVESPDDRKPEGTQSNAKSVWFIFKPNGSRLQEIIGLAKMKRLVDPVIDSIWDWQDFQKAFDRVSSGHARGKVVLQVI